MKMRHYKTFFVGMLALAFYLSHGAYGQSCSFNGGELLVRVPNILPNPVEYTVKMVAKTPQIGLDDEPTFLQVWDRQAIKSFLLIHSTKFLLQKSSILQRWVVLHSNG